MAQEGGSRSLRSLDPTSCLLQTSTSQCSVRCYGTQFTSAAYVETLNRLGIQHRRTAYNHPEGNSYIERFHRSLKEEEVWINEYQSFDHARQSIALWIEEYNHDRPHRGLGGRTPHESRAAFQAITLTSNQASPVYISRVHYTAKPILVADVVETG